MGSRRALLGIVAVFSLAVSGTASASAISFASTTIDWSQFSSTDVLAYTNQYSIPIAEAEANYVRAAQVRNDLAGWGSTSSSNVMTNTIGYGATTANTVYAEGQALADGVATVESNGSAFVGRGGYFTLSAPTTLNFSVPFAFQHNISLDGPSDGAYAQSTVFLWLGLATGQTIDATQVNFYHSGSSGSWSSNGILTFSSGAPLAAGSYAFDISAFAAAYAQAETVVPESSTLLLVGLGLVGGFALRRRRPGR